MICEDPLALLNQIKPNQKTNPPNNSSDVMKSRFALTILAAAALTSVSRAQTTVYTNPVGYTTQTLKQGINALGLTLQTPALATGAFETVTPTTLTDNNVTYTPVAGRTYVLEITGGSLTGSIFEIPAANISGSTISVITTPATNLVTLGLTTSATYKLRVAPTLEEIFTTVPFANGGVLKAALSAGSADIIWIPIGSGAYAKYYLKSSTRAFHDASTNAASPNVPIVYADGFFVQKKDSALASLTITGELKTVGTNSVLTQGFNLISAVAPVGLNLFNAGLEDDLTAALSAGSADEVWIQQSDLSYIKYFRRSGAGAGWRISGTNTTLSQAQAESVVLSPGFQILKKSQNPVNLDLNVPPGYTSL